MESLGEIRAALSPLLHALDAVDRGDARSTSTATTTTISARHPSAEGGRKRRRLDVDEIEDRGPRPAAAERDRRRRRRRMLNPHERHGDGGRCIVVGDAPVHGREVAWARRR